MGSRSKLKSNPSATGSQVSLGSSKSSAPAEQLQEHGSTLQKHSAGASQSWSTKSWPRGSKAAAVTEVARESISVAGTIASDFITSTTSLPDSPKAHRSRSIQLTNKAASSSRSLPADAATTRININSDGSTCETAETISDVPRDGTNGDENGTLESRRKAEGKKEVREPIAQDQSGHAKISTPETEATSKPSDQSTYWLGWLYRGGASAEKPNAKKMGAKASPDKDSGTGAANDTTESGLTNETAPTRGSGDSADAIVNSQAEQMTAEQESMSPSQKRTWMQMWGGTTPASKSKEDLQHSDAKRERRLDPGQTTSATPDVIETQSSEAEQTQATEASTGKSSGWAFWSRDVPKDQSTDGAKQQEETGELAVTGSAPLKSKSGDTVPEVEIQPKSQRESQDNQQSNSKKVSKSKIVKDTPVASEAATSTEDTLSPPVPARVKTSEVTASKQLQSVLTNQLLPSFRDTFALQESPSWLQSLGRFLHYSKEPENKHVHVVRDPPRPRKALAIGVHGYFPAPYLRTVLGQPTGTSLKFSNMAAKAIHHWTDNHGYQCDIEKISLEGEGRIADRVDLLWKLLLNWMDDIQKADFIMFACHSQGVPVTVMLVAKLISFGCLNATRVGICAMAGVNLGPFPDYKSRWIGGSAGELFDFANPTTKVSLDYEAALKTALDFGVRISYVGSIDDQLVSLESSLFVSASHPYIYRAVFVDGRVHAPSFLSHLVGFILKLRNLGIQDHGLIRELSAPLVGSLVGGEGHSRLHDEENIYYLAVEFALETSNINGMPLNIKRYGPTTTFNPYILPFAMRGLLEEDYVRRELHQESIELLKQFDDWKPVTKVLKDVKFRLEGIRSKL